MAKRPRRPRDPNVLAKLIVDMATGAVPREPAPQPDTPAIQARRKGGRKGGEAGGQEAIGEAAPRDCEKGRRGSLDATVTPQNTRHLNHTPLRRLLAV